VKVLAVDDSAAYRRLVENSVTSLGYQCITAEDGVQAWELFQGGGVDVVISNWMMPGLEGDELCRRIRGSDHPYAYFILFTAREGKRNVMHGMEAGADDYFRSRSTRTSWRRVWSTRNGSPGCTACSPSSRVSWSASTATCMSSPARTR
jgi:CheY-like chemotaxis protein